MQASWVTCGFLCTCLLACGCAPVKFTKNPPPHLAVVINPDQFWKTSLCGDRPVAEVVTLDTQGEYPRFVVLDIMQRHIWLNYMAMHFSRRDYPIAVIRYRARNIHKTNYLMWMDDDTGLGQTGVSTFMTGDLILDGQEHELRQDLRKQKTDGNVTGIWLAVHCGQQGPAPFELIDLRFEADIETGEPDRIEEDEPITVRIVDPDNNPVAGAAITVDHEFRNWVRSAVTDEYGKATVTPLIRPAGEHMMCISKAGMVPIEVQRRIFLPVKVLTDEQGRWSSPPLPQDLTQMKVRMAHRDYVRDPLMTFYKDPSDPIDEDLRDHSAIRILEEGLTIAGRVTDTQGAPLAGIQVALDSEHWKPNVPTSTTDADGHFSFAHHPVGKIKISTQKDGYAAEKRTIDLQESKADIEMILKPAKR